MIYEFSAIVYNTRQGEEFGRTSYIQIVARSLDEAWDMAGKSFTRYCSRLAKNHKGFYAFSNLRYIIEP